MSGRVRSRGVHVEQSLRPIHLQGVALQGERVWEARVKCLDLVVQPDGEQVYHRSNA